MGVAGRTLSSVAVVAGLVSLQGCSDDVRTADEQARTSIAAVRGLPQDGQVLGAGAGPTLMVFSRVDDLRLADFVAEALPRLVHERVGPGRLKVRLQTIAAASDADGDSLRLARLAQAAGLQDHLWEFLGSAVARYPGVIDDEFTRAALGDVPALRSPALTRDGASPRVQAAIDRANSRARSLDLPGFAYVIEHRTGGLEVLRARTPGGLLRDLADPAGRVSHRVPAMATPVAVKPAPRREDQRHPFRNPLRLGATGPLVEELQKGLRDASPGDSAALKVTGVYDAATLEAVSAFQRDHGLEADGETGELTWAAIFSPPTRSR